MPEQRIDIAWNAHYQLTQAENPKELVILLHGYQQKGLVIQNSLRSCFHSDVSLLAPDAPFPVPEKIGEGYRLGYTWYFFDPINNVYLHDMDTCLDYLMALVKALGFNNLPTRVVGYSQGGYLAPHLALRLPHAFHVIGINCRFRSEALDEPLPFRLDAIHGERDPMVDPERARRCHEELLARGNLGRFQLIPDCGHGINGEVRETLKKFFQTCEAAP